ncbi:MAG: protein TolQ [Myxococcota bacterium]
MLDLILGASLVVKAVLVMLLAMSVTSWAVIFYKVREFARADLDSEAFLEAYLEQPLDQAYREARERPSSPIAALFQAGYRDLSQLRRASSGRPKDDQIEEMVDRLAWIEAEQQHRLGRGLAFLATTGSSAPFIGLFGTVVGIMNAFQHIGATGSASLAVVAPGIAEALFATAVGLFAAIPAVIGYNYASARVSRSLDRLEAFRGDFSNALRRSGAQPA